MVRSAIRTTLVTALELRGIKVALNGSTLIELDHTVHAGEVLTIMGASGSGKSTLLAYVAGFIDPAFEVQGRVIVDGRDVTSLVPEQRRIGLIFQDPLLLPQLTVEQNLMFGMRGLARGRQARREQAHRALSSIGLDAMAQRLPMTLSGGEQSRVAVLRLLLSRPAAVLMDEPFSSLDAGTRDHFRQFVFDSLKELPVILVTHDPDDAHAAGGPVVRI